MEHLNNNFTKKKKERKIEKDDHETVSYSSQLLYPTDQ